MDRSNFRQKKVIKMHYFVDTSKTIGHIVYMMKTNKGDNIMTIYTWNTKKNQNNTYSYIVKKVIPTDEIQEDGTYSITTIEKIGACKTRAKAKRKGIQWARYFKSQEQA